jgi:hypothetical protein
MSPQMEDLPDGHRLFQRGDDTYILDDTGSDPETTRIGPMKLNDQVPLVLGQESAIPAENKDGVVERIKARPDTIVALAAKFDWQVTDGESLFKIERTGAAA